MSSSYSAILNRSDVPTLDVLQQALKRLEFKLIVDESYVPFESSGYLPCTINGEDGGFNIRFEALEPYLDRFPQVRPQAGTRDTLISLRSGGDPREQVCGLMFAATLAQNFCALVHDPKKDAFLSVDELLGQARSQFADLD